MLPKDVVVLYIETFNRGDLEGLCELFTSDALVWGVLGWGEIEKVKPIWKQFMESLQMNLTLQGIIAEGDTVAARYIERGKSVSSFQGFGATGKSYELTAMEWFEIRDDRIHRRWGARDSASQYRQLGFVQ
ncbi:MAG: nuclear transport factor 2 family protein [Gammaproteobacteria bacterium]|nr:ester cyclase [Pseudomonadales bacterium]